jgi:ketosteroid isomerase-like protein
MKQASVQDELDVRRLMATYCHLCDDAAFDAVVGLFTPDAALVYGEREAHGSEEIRAFFEEFQGELERRGKHLQMNVVVDVEGDRARSQSDVLFVRYFDGALLPHVAARYRDELARVDGQWRFTRREIERLNPPGA